MFLAEHATAGSVHFRFKFLKRIVERIPDSLMLVASTKLRFVLVSTTKMGGYLNAVS
jgi:hypothetical protein